MGCEVGSAPACYANSLGSNPDITQKYKMGDICKGVANTLYIVRQKIKKSFGLPFLLVSYVECILFLKTQGIAFSKNDSKI